MQKQTCRQDGGMIDHPPGVLVIEKTGFLGNVRFAHGIAAHDVLFVIHHHEFLFLAAGAFISTSIIVFVDGAKAWLLHRHHNN